MDDINHIFALIYWVVCRNPLGDGENWDNRHNSAEGKKAVKCSLLPLIFCLTWSPCYLFFLSHFYACLKTRTQWSNLQPRRKRETIMYHWSDHYNSLLTVWPLQAKNQCMLDYINTYFSVICILYLYSRNVYHNLSCLYSIVPKNIFFVWRVFMHENSELFRVWWCIIFSCQWIA